jgi:hypothetical protein
MTYDETEAQRAPFEAKHAPIIRAALMAEGEVLARLVRAEDFPLSAFLDRSGVDDALRALWQEVIPHFAALVSAEVAAMKRAIPADVWLEAARRFVEREGGSLIREIGETTLAVVRAIVQEGITEGWSFDKIADALLERWPEIADVRSLRIVRTEVIRASNHGSLEGARVTAEETGIDLVKVWLATPDPRTRDSHSEADGQRVGLEEAFTVGGHRAMYPGDASLPAAESVNCRCTLVYEPAEAKSWRDERDGRIRQEYPALRQRVGYVQALDEIAEREGLSEGQVRRIVYSGKRS